MEFYTKKWKEYVYSNFYNAFPKCAKRQDDVEYDEYLKKNEFYKYYDLKKEYVSLIPKLKEEFGKYEPVELLTIEEEEKLFEEKRIEFINKCKNNDIRIINFLKEKNIEVNLDINDVDYNLLSLNIKNEKTTNFYKKLTEIYNKYLKENLTNDQYYEIKCNEIDNIGYMRNYVSSFLTDYQDYLKSKNKICFYNKINEIIYDDEVNTKTKYNGQDIIIEYYNDISTKSIITIKNPQIRLETNGKIEEEIKLEQNEKVNIVSYETYEDFLHYFNVMIFSESELIGSEKIREFKNINKLSRIDSDFIMNLEEYAEDSESDIESLESYIDANIISKSVEYETF